MPSTESLNKFLATSGLVVMGFALTTALLIIGQADEALVQAERETMKAEVLEHRVAIIGERPDALVSIGQAELDLFQEVHLSLWEKLSQGTITPDELNQLSYLTGRNERLLETIYRRQQTEWEELLMHAETQADLQAAKYRVSLYEDGLPLALGGLAITFLVGLLGTVVGFFHWNRENPLAAVRKKSLPKW